MTDQVRAALFISVDHISPVGFVCTSFRAENSSVSSELSSRLSASLYPLTVTDIPVKGDKGKLPPSNTIQKWRFGLWNNTASSLDPFTVSSNLELCLHYRNEVNNIWGKSRTSKGFSGGFSVRTDLPWSFLQTAAEPFDSLQMRCRAAIKQLWSSTCWEASESDSLGEERLRRGSHLHAEDYACSGGRTHVQIHVQIHPNSESGHTCSQEEDSTGKSLITQWAAVSSHSRDLYHWKHGLPLKQHNVSKCVC